MRVCAQINPLKLCAKAASADATSQAAPQGCNLTDQSINYISPRPPRPVGVGSVMSSPPLPLPAHRLPAHLPTRKPTTNHPPTHPPTPPPTTHPSTHSPMSCLSWPRGARPGGLARPAAKEGGRAHRHGGGRLGGPRTPRPIARSDEKAQNRVRARPRACRGIHASLIVSRLCRDSTYFQSGARGADQRAAL